MDALRAYRCFPAASEYRRCRLCAMPLRGAREDSGTAQNKQSCAFGHWCAARDCMVNANSGTAVGSLVAVVPLGNGYVSSMILSPLDPGLLHPGLHSHDVPRCTGRDQIVDWPFDVLEIISPFEGDVWVQVPRVPCASPQGLSWVPPASRLVLSVTSRSLRSHCRGAEQG